MGLGLPKPTFDNIKNVKGSTILEFLKNYENGNKVEINKSIKKLKNEMER